VGADKLDSAVDAGRMYIGNAAPVEGLGEGWWITPYTQDANPELTTVEAVIARPDLFPDKEDPSKGFFMGCPAGWGCQLASASLFKAHGMAEKGWILGDPGTSAGLNGSISKASEQGENWFGYYWAPTTFLAKYDLRAVDLGPFAGTENWDCVILGADNCADPQPSGWTVSRVNTMLSENFSYNGPKEANAYFAARVYPFSVLNSVLVWADENQATGSDSAAYFLANHEDTWKAWVDADVAAEVEAAL
jgi:glycine betaine/proline transport system substrate-binding protein